MTKQDSFNVTENEDGSFTVEWDPNDPLYSVFNDMTSEQMSAYFTKAIEEFMKEENNETTV